MRMGQEERAKDRENARAAMLKFMNQRTEFTAAEVFAALGGKTYQIENIWSELRWKDLIHEIRRDGPTRIYSLLSPQDKQADAARKRREPHGVIWTAICTLGKFTHDDIVNATEATDAPVDAQTVRQYCNALMYAGYLAVKVKARPSAGVPATFQLVRRTGPIHPKLRRTMVVVDQNEDRVAWVSGERLP